MYTQLSVKDLRGVSELTVAGLRPINLFVGKNNSGKTTLLEGVFLLGGATNPVYPTTLSLLRGQRLGPSSPEACWRPLFSQLDPRRVIRIEGVWEEDGAPRRLEIRALEASTFAESMETGTGGGIAAITDAFVIVGLQLHYRSAWDQEMTTTAVFNPRSGDIEAPGRERSDFVRTVLLSARSYPSLERNAHQFSALLRTKQEQDVLDAVRIIEPAVTRIEVLSEPSGPAVYVDVGLDSLVPLAVCGEGIVRLFSIAVELATSRGGVLLIDEIDNGLHYSVMPGLWRLLGVLCQRHRVQVFATTHNEELLLSALEAFKDVPDTLGLFRIDRRGGKHAVTTYDAEMQETVGEHHFEVRG